MLMCIDFEGDIRFTLNSSFWSFFFFLLLILSGLGLLSHHGDMLKVPATKCAFSWMFPIHEVWYVWMKYQNTQKDTWNENLHIFLCQLIKTCFVLSDKKNCILWYFSEHQQSNWFQLFVWVYRWKSQYLYWNLYFGYGECWFSVLLFLSITTKKEKHYLILW